MSLDEAIDEYGDLVLHIAWRITGDEAATQDVCQETFLKLHAAWDRGQHVEHLTAWLGKVAVNAALDVKRHRARHVPLDEDAWPRCDPGAIAAIDRPILLDQISRRIPHLPERQRGVFLLRHSEGLPFEEIARLVGITPLAARSASFQALEKMRGWLTSEPESRPDSSQR